MSMGGGGDPKIFDLGSGIPTGPSDAEIGQRYMADTLWNNYYNRAMPQMANQIGNGARLNQLIVQQNQMGNGGLMARGLSQLNQATAPQAGLVAGMQSRNAARMGVQADPATQAAMNNANALTQASTRVGLANQTRLNMANAQRDLRYSGGLGGIYQ